jgi:hypothetical protein
MELYFIKSNFNWFYVYSDLYYFYMDFPDQTFCALKLPLLEQSSFIIRTIISYYHNGAHAPRLDDTFQNPLYGRKWMFHFY